MEETIAKYLNQHYEVVDCKRIKSLLGGGYILGSKVVEELKVIFSVEEKICYDLVKNWFIEKAWAELIKPFWFEQKKYSPDEPKKVNRFLITFPTEFNIEQYMVKSASRPSYNQHFGTGTFFSRHSQPITTWDDIDIVFYDLISPSSAQIIMGLLRENKFNNFQFKLEMLGPIGDVVEEWEITGTVSKVSFGDLDYSSNEISNISMTISPSTCVLLY